MSLVKLANLPRPVPLAGREVYVSELRFVDLAALDLWIVRDFGDPFEEIAGTADLAPDERREALKALWEKHRKGPPRLDTPEGSALLSTPRGIAYFLGVALAIHQPGITSEECIGLYIDAKPGEIDRISCLAYWLDPLELLEALIDPIPRFTSGQATFAEIVDSVSRDRSLSYEEAMRMTPSQAGYVARKGKDSERGYTPAPGEDIAALARRRREAFYGPGGVGGIKPEEN